MGLQGASGAWVYMWFLRWSQGRDGWVGERGACRPRGTVEWRVPGSWAANCHCSAVIGFWEDRGLELPSPSWLERRMWSDHSLLTNIKQGWVLILALSQFVSLCLSKLARTLTINLPGAPLHYCAMRLPQCLEKRRKSEWFVLKWSDKDDWRFYWARRSTPLSPSSFSCGEKQLVLFLFTIVWDIKAGSDPGGQRARSSQLSGSTLFDVWKCWSRTSNQTC